MEFNSVQRVIAKLFYSLISQLTGEQRAGALQALSLLIPAAEDGYLKANGAELKTDFFAQCFDVLAGVALALKLAEDDGLIPQNFPEVPLTGVFGSVTEAEMAITRLEAMLASTKTTYQG